MFSQFVTKTPTDIDENEMGVTNSIFKIYILVYLYTYIYYIYKTNTNLVLTKEIK